MWGYQCIVKFKSKFNQLKKYESANALKHEKIFKKNIKKQVIIKKKIRRIKLFWTKSTFHTKVNSLLRLKQFKLLK